MDPYRDAMLLLSFQEERHRNRVDKIAKANASPRPVNRRTRLMLASGSLLIVIGSRLQQWSGTPSVEAAADPANEVAWQ